MAGAQVIVALTQIEKQRLGYQAISLTEFSSDLEPEIAAGSKVEIGGALFEFVGNESITGWAGIGAGNDVYIKLTVAGAAVTASFTTTPPTWSESKQGFYDALERYIGGLYKDAGGDYTRKFLYGKWYENNQNVIIRADGSIEAAGGVKTGSERIITETYSLGSWNMDAVQDKEITHGLTPGSIRRVTASIMGDDGVSWLEHCWTGPGFAVPGIGILWNDTIIRLRVYPTGIFDSTSFDDIGVVRGYCFIDYVPD